MLIEEFDDVLCGVCWCYKGNMVVGSSINYMIKGHGDPLAISPVYPVQIHFMVKIHHGLKVGWPRCLRWTTFDTGGTADVMHGLHYFWSIASGLQGLGHSLRRWMPQVSVHFQKHVLFPTGQ